LPVPRDLLEAVAAKLPSNRDPFKGRAGGSGHGPGIDLPAWVQKHGLDVVKEGPWEGGHRYVLRTCPFNEAHTDRSACIVQFSSGAISFRCHHNSCTGNGWRELRQLFEPGCYERSQQNDSARERKAPGGNPGGTGPESVALVQTLADVTAC